MKHRHLFTLLLLTMVACGDASTGEGGDTALACDEALCLFGKADLDLSAECGIPEEPAEGSIRIAWMADTVPGGCPDWCPGGEIDLEIREWAEQVADDCGGELVSHKVHCAWWADSPDGLVCGYYADYQTTCED